MGSRPLSAPAGHPTLELLLLGFASTLAQVVLLRELSVASFGIELIYLLALGVWLLCNGAGALAADARCAAPPGAAAALFLAAAVLVPLDVAFLRASRILLGGVPGAYLPLGRQAAVLAVSLAPLCLAFGALFALTARRYLGSGGTLAGAYAWESAGCALGGVSGTLALRLGGSNLLLAGVCCAAAAGAALPALGRWGPAARWVSAAVVALALAVLVPGVPRLDLAATRWSHPSAVAVRDTPYGRVTVTRSEGQVAVFSDDALSHETEGAEAESFVHLVALQAASPSTVLLLGGATEGLVGEALRHGPDRVDCVETDAALLDAVVPLLPEAYRRNLRHESVHLHVEDPRRFLRRKLDFDLILVAMPEPGSGQTNRYYTREFFAECAARLKPGGVLGFRLPSAENYRAPLTSLRTEAVYRALSSAFRDVLVLPGAVNVFAASQGPLLRDPQRLAARLGERRIQGRLVTAAYLRYLYTNDRLPELEAALRSSRAPVNSDGAPVSYQHTAALWLSRFFPELARGELPGVDAARKALWWAAPALLGLFAVARRARLWRGTLLAGAAGFVGMAVEGSLLLHYQTKQGVLYQDIGLLVTSFMVGLVAGAAGFGRWARRGRVSRWWSPGIALAGAAALSCLALAGLVEAGALSSLGMVAAALAVVAALTAGLFTWAGSRFGCGAGRLYGADLLGGCVGSLAGALWLVPLAGLGSSVAVAAVVAAAALLLV